MKYTSVQTSVNKEDMKGFGSTKVSRLHTMCGHWHIWLNGGASKGWDHKGQKPVKPVNRRFGETIPSKERGLGDWQQKIQHPELNPKCRL